MIIQKNYAGLNFVSRNLLDSAAGGTFMEITLGEATKLLDNILTNYSQWHTEQTPTGMKVNSVEEINTLSDKLDALLKLVASKNVLGNATENKYFRYSEHARDHYGDAYKVFDLIVTDS